MFGDTQEEQDQRVEKFKELPTSVQRAALKYGMNWVKNSGRALEGYCKTPFGESKKRAYVEGMVLAGSKRRRAK